MADYSDTLYGKILIVVRDVVRGLSLEAIEADEMQIRKVSPDDRMKFRGLSFVWDDPKTGEGSCGEDEVGYPVIISMSMGSDAGWDDNMPLLLKWREQIFETFADRRPLSALSHDGMTIKICRVDWGAQWLSKPWKDRWDQSLMVIWVWVKTVRS